MTPSGCCCKSKYRSKAPGYRHTRIWWLVFKMANKKSLRLQYGTFHLLTPWPAGSQGETMRETLSLGDKAKPLHALAYIWRHRAQKDFVSGTGHEYLTSLMKHPPCFSVYLTGATHGCWCCKSSLCGDFMEMGDFTFHLSWHDWCLGHVYNTPAACFPRQGKHSCNVCSVRKASEKARYCRL